MSATVHTYRTALSWEGSTGVGYDDYGRAHRLSAITTDGPVATATDGSLHLSGDPAFLGDPTLLNPEQLLVAAASSCHLLSFLAIAARRRLDVIAYRDEAEGEMPEDDRPMRITRIVLRPHVVLRSDDPATADELAGLHDKAHHLCFVANSLTTHIEVLPTFDVVPRPASS